MSHKKSRKHDVGRGGGGVNLSLIITPMLDMSFQLLAFFVMTYHPPVNVGFVEGSLLPPTKIFISEKKGKDKNPNPPKEAPKEPPPPPVDKEPDVGSDLLLVVVRSVKAGQKEGNRENGDPSTIEIKRTGPQAIEPMIISGNPAEPKERFVEGLRKDLDRELKAILDRPASKILRGRGGPRTQARSRRRSETSLLDELLRHLQNVRLQEHQLRRPRTGPGPEAKMRGTGRGAGFQPAVLRTIWQSRGCQIGMDRR